MDVVSTMATLVLVRETRASLAGVEGTAGEAGIGTGEGAVFPGDAAISSSETTEAAVLVGYLL
jgi:hypothetical protein